VRLDEVDEETFEMVQHWLYKGELIFGGDSEPEREHLVLLSKVWNFGDKYLIAPLQNSVIDVIHYLLADEYFGSPKELQDFIDHTFPIFENNNDQHGNRIGESADLDDCNMVQLLIVHKFALGHWGIGDVGSDRGQPSPLQCIRQGFDGTNEEHLIRYPQSSANFVLGFR